MKVYKVGSKISPRLTLPEDLPWRILGAVSKDLRLIESDSPNTDLPDLSNTPESERLSGAIRRRSRKELSDLTITFGPQCMLEGLVGDTKEAYSFFAKYQVGSLLKKYPEKGANSRQAAFSKFFQLEERCRLYNSENYKALLAISTRHPDFLGVVEEMQNDILRLIGEFPNVGSVYYNAKHGPGMSIGALYSEGRVTEFYKWSNLPYSCTRNCIPYAKEAILSDPRWIGALDDWYRREENIPLGAPIDLDHFWSKVIHVVEYSKITTVPKSAEIDRTIAIEPLLNLFLQLGVDQVIRRRLRARWNYDLDDQEPNQLLAKEAAMTDLFATVDLSGASDTISLKICEILLPPAWYALLLDLRAPLGRCEGTEAPYEKISSMGNGFTFALESLIFGALVRCAIRRTQSVRRSAVFGDDLIVPSTAFKYLVTILNLCGFSVNEGKSFASGPFRESCGKDYFLRYDVRPVFLTSKITTLPDLFYVHNAFMALEQRLDWAWSVRFSHTRALIRKYIPKQIRDHFYGPASDVFDSYLFSSRRLHKNSVGERIGYRITPTANRYSASKDSFFFRKLMVSLKSGRPKSNFWEKRSLPNSGNAFDIVRRDRVTYRVTRARVW
jgi:hypothetical protein